MRIRPVGRGSWLPSEFSQWAPSSPTWFGDRSSRPTSCRLPTTPSIPVVRHGAGPRARSRAVLGTVHPVDEEEEGPKHCHGGSRQACRGSRGHQSTPRRSRRPGRRGPAGGGLQAAAAAQKNAAVAQKEHHHFASQPSGLDVGHRSGPGHARVRLTRHLLVALDRDSECRKGKHRVGGCALIERCSVSPEPGEEPESSAGSAGDGTSRRRWDQTAARLDQPDTNHVGQVKGQRFRHNDWLTAGHTGSPGNL